MLRVMRKIVWHYSGYVGVPTCEQCVRSFGESLKLPQRYSKYCYENKGTLRLKKTKGKTGQVSHSIVH